MLDYSSKSSHPDPSIRHEFNIANGFKERGEVVKAKIIFRKLCDKCCSDSMVNLGTLCMDGTPEEKEEALMLFKRAADMGNDSGMRNTGYSYSLGLGCTPDKKLAAEWYERAGQHGNAKAQCNLGVLFEFGHGVPKSDEDAAEMYLMSAKNGYSRGQTNIGCMYLEGRGIDRDVFEAEKWLTMSGTPRARYHLARMYLYGIGIEKDEIRGMGHLESASTDGHSKSMALLASLLEERDMSESVKLYIVAASKGNRDASKRLKELGISSEIKQ